MHRPASLVLALGLLVIGSALGVLRATDPSPDRRLGSLAGRIDAEGPVEVHLAGPDGTIRRVLRASAPFFRFDRLRPGSYRPCVRLPEGRWIVPVRPARGEAPDDATGRRLGDLPFRVRGRLADGRSGPPDGPLRPRLRGEPG